MNCDEFIQEIKQIESRMVHDDYTVVEFCHDLTEVYKKHQVCEVELIEYNRKIGKERAMPTYADIKYLLDRHGNQSEEGDATPVADV